MAKVRTSAGVTKGSDGAKSVNPLYAAARGVARYVGGAAREVRDIPTALGTLQRANKTGAGGTIDMAKENLALQVKEAANAVVKGKKGTSSDYFQGITYSYGPKRK